MTSIPHIFGSMVFDDTAMKERLPEDVYLSLQRTIKMGRHLHSDVADAVASAMKDWAIEKGATHYTHWFQPLTGITAEKHDSFLVPGKNGKVLMEFSGKELVRGETDGSSFPSGKLRTTFEARGYTAWDATSYAFIKDKTLCIPTAFYSYGGDALDKKTPLLRSMERLEKAALRILRLFGNDTVSAIRTTVGAEQEYFLIDRALSEKRPDILHTGRTLFGARPPKGQELDDHYSAAIPTRVKAYMEDLDNVLWEMGVLAKTEHNEAAPAQYELAPIFSTANIATDHNQLTMEMMQRVAERHGFLCLLAEKPFDGISGSGKHNNWAMSTDTGVNLLEPGETPAENAQFLLFLVAVIAAVDTYQDLLRISIASAGNDRRLGGDEAPPAIVSIFLGDDLTAVLDSLLRDTPLGKKEKELLRVGVHTLPRFPKDSTDRNRTSPFAFTGNKFEFRMPGASSSIADCNTILNSAVAHTLTVFADRLEGAADFESALHDLIVSTLKAHKRILFNGNGYDKKWKEEAKERGLSEFASTPEALAHLLDEKNVALFTELGVFSKAELCARHHIMAENYVKILRIEAATMLDMARQAILPAVVRYTKELCDAAIAKKAIALDTTYEQKTAGTLSTLTKDLSRGVDSLIAAMKAAETATDVALAYRKKVLPAMDKLRLAADRAENLVPKDIWPYPSYSDLLFSVR